MRYTKRFDKRRVRFTPLPGQTTIDDMLTSTHYDKPKSKSRKTLKRTHVPCDDARNELQHKQKADHV